MSVLYVYVCDVDDCYNNSMNNDNVSFYDIDIGNETAYKELHGEGHHICDDCLCQIKHDYPEVTLDDYKELVYWDYLK